MLYKENLMNLKILFYNSSLTQLNFIKMNNRLYKFGWYLLLLCSVVVFRIVFVSSGDLSIMD